MSECQLTRESMPLLLTESLDPARRELAHQHIESCAACAVEWTDQKETWAVLGDLPEVPVPQAVRQRFLEAAGLAEPVATVLPFRRRPVAKWLAQAAAVVVIAGGAWFAGNRTAPRFVPTGATIDSVRVQPVSTTGMIPIAETRILDAAAVSPQIEGRPRIDNVQFVDADASDNRIGLSFDLTSRWTVNGNPSDQSMVRLLSYVLESEAAMPTRSNTIDLVRRTYSNPEHAQPEIAEALAKVLRSEDHEGVRIRAVETLKGLPSASVEPASRDALIAALKNDPNPSVRIKAIEALAQLARTGAPLDAEALDTLRQKAAQDDENLYVRVKAAEALSAVRP